MDARFDDLLQRAARLTPVPVSDTPRLSAGTVLCNGRFEVGARIGRGGAGVVHGAIDHHRGKRVALKSLARLDPVGIGRLKREFRALADVIHPNLVRLHDLHADNGLWLFSMEWVHGVSFDRWVRPSGRLELPRLHAAMAQLVAAVEAIHAVGKLHRDLKPDNVLVCEDGRVVVLDFGLVADPLRGKDGVAVVRDRVTGTPAYMAPEQCAALAASEASDWYQVGVMLFEALAGTLPFTGPSNALMERKQACDAPDVKAHWPEVPAALRQLCAELLQRDPRRRPGSPALHAHFPPEAPATTVPSSILPPPAEAPLVGREPERLQLERAYRASAAGTAALVHVIADSGLGKSTLVERFLAGVPASEGAVVLSGRCYEREHVPYKAFDRPIDALTRHLRGLSEADVATLLPRDAHALVRIFPVLAQVAAFARAPAAAVAGERAQRQRGWDALCELLAGLRARAPLVVHIDDAQWLDADSLQLLQHLLSQPQPTPMLLLLGHRPAPALAGLAYTGEAGVQRIQLRPLRPEAARELAAALLDGGAAGAFAPSARDGLVQAIAREGEGNPFLISELVQAVLQRPAPLAPDTPDLPGTVSLDALVLGRSAGLGEGARALLRLVAVSGRPVPTGVVVGAAHVLDDPHGELDLLCATRLLHRGQDGTLQCHHDRIGRAIEGELGEAARRDCHARLAEAWEAAGDADPEVLLQHHAACGNDGRAGGYALLAAERAVALLAFERGIGFYRQAMRLLPVAQVHRQRVRERLAAVLSLAGRWGEAGAEFALLAAAESSPEDGAEASAPPGLDLQSGGAPLAQQAARHLLGSGRLREGLPQLRRSLDARGIAWPRSAFSAWAGAAWGLLVLCVTGARYRLTQVTAPPRLAGLDGGAGESEGEVGGRRATVGAEAGGRVREMHVVEGLLDGAGLLPPYDLPRGAYYAVAFIRRALAWGERARVAVALGMLATMVSTSRLGRALGRRLAGESESLARRGHEPDLAAAALGFAGFARMLDGELSRAAELGAEGAHLLRDVGRTHVYQRWAAQGLEATAYMLMGEMRRGAQLSARIATEARLLGDDLALVGGAALVGHLLEDDVAAAEALLAEKRAVLGRVGSRGVLNQIVCMERACLALYLGRGAGALDGLSMPTAGGIAPFNMRALAANCVLQGLDAGPRGGAARRRALRTLRATRRALARDGGALHAGVVHQLDAAMSMVRGERALAASQLARAGVAYGAANMGLHADVMRLREGQLLRCDRGAAQVREATAAMRARGIVSPGRWAGMLAAGFGAEGERASPAERADGDDGNR